MVCTCMVEIAIEPDKNTTDDSYTIRLGISKLGRNTKVTLGTSLMSL